MKVKELIKILKDCDPNAEVALASQPGYPYAELRFMRNSRRGPRVLDAPSEGGRSSSRR